MACFIVLLRCRKDADGCNAPTERLIAAGIGLDLQNDNGASCLMYVASNSKPGLTHDQKNEWHLRKARGSNFRSFLVSCGKHHP